MELQVISSQEVLGKEFRVYGDVENPMFLAKDVANWIEHSNSRMMLQGIDEDEKVCVNNPCALKGQQEQWFLTENGVIKVLSKCRKLSGEKKVELLKETFPHRYLDNSLINFSSASELEFLDCLESMLKPFKLKTKRQKIVKGKRIDLYIEDLKVAIEYDENNHAKYDKKEEKLRQEMIEKELGCRFIRVSDKNSHMYNCGLVLKELFKIRKVG